MSECLVYDEQKVIAETSAYQPTRRFAWQLLVRILSREDVEVFLKNPHGRPGTKPTFDLVHALRMCFFEVCLATRGVAVWF